MLARDFPDNAQLLNLIEARTPGSVSLVIGSSPLPADHDRARIALRDAIDEAARRLEVLELPRGARAATVERLREALQDDELWANQSRGMLILATADEMQWYRLPFEVSDDVSVGDRFDLRMLLRARSDASSAFVLQLSRGLVRLTEIASGTDVVDHPLHLPDDHDLMLEHASNDGRADRASAQGSDGDRPERERFCRAVNEAVVAVIPRGAPLILAVTDDFRPAYRAENTHALLLEDEIPAHPESLADQELADRALEVLRLRRERKVAEWKERFGSLRAQGLATSRVSQVAAAAAAAAIEELRLDQDAERSGTVDEFGRVHAGGDGRFLLLDLAADVLRTGGTVIAVPREELTDGSPVAAILRFPVPSPTGG
ncbi:hypothetical protein [Microbacterium lushaniae]|uniref:Uncharacterized protein n=1 Tax=Microbacterium lushaniae TaxID=2614639 RepID=A0A5J6L5C2_9MICO|nr:hypothetical protein [Microbacterium lushaniae]QEW03733.1 hypothetical protein F6J85_11945 [Microbacterium lushaniae]